VNEREETLLQLLGYVLLQNARPEKAAVLLGALTILSPGQPRVLRMLALSQLRAGMAQRALDTLDLLAMGGGVDAVFHLLRAQALGALQRPDEAAQSMQAFVQLRADKTPGADA
jgi:hypothetical protein